MLLICLHYHDQDAFAEGDILEVNGMLGGARSPAAPGGGRARSGVRICYTAFNVLLHPVCPLLIDFDILVVCIADTHTNKRASSLRLSCSRTGAAAHLKHQLASL